MKRMVSIVFLTLIAGCASEPTRIVVKNCDLIGPNLYSCEEVERMEFQPHRN